MLKVEKNYKKLLQTVIKLRHQSRKRFLLNVIILTLRQNNLKLSKLKYN